MDNFIGIGELSLPDNLKLPPFHALIFFEPDSVRGEDYGALNLEFNIISYGKSPTESIAHLKELLTQHVEFGIKKLGWDNFFNAICSNEGSDGWRTYRKLLFTLTHQERPTLLNVAQKTSCTLKEAV